VQDGDTVASMALQCIQHLSRSISAMDGEDTPTSQGTGRKHMVEYAHLLTPEGLALGGAVKPNLSDIARLGKQSIE